MVAAGLSGITATVGANTRLQLLTPDVYRGRVMSLFVMLMGGTTPIGALMLGGIAEAWGIRLGLVIFGALPGAGLLAVVALGRWTADRDARPQRSDAARVLPVVAAGPVPLAVAGGLLPSVVEAVARVEAAARPDAVASVEAVPPIEAPVAPDAE